MVSNVVIDLVVERRGFRIPVRMFLALLNEGNVVDEVVKLRSTILSLYRVKPVHLVVVVSGTNIDGYVSRGLHELEVLGIELVTVNIGKLMDRIQIAALGRILAECSSIKNVDRVELVKNIDQIATLCSDLIYPEEFVAKLRTIVEELGLAEAIDRAIERVSLKELGLMDPMKSYDDYVNAMKWVFSVPKNSMSVEEVWNYVSGTLARYRIFGERSHVLALDIESVEQLRRYVEVLAKEGFIEFDGSTIVADKLHPYEDRILKVLKNVYGGSCREEQLKRIFVPMTSQFENVWNAILSILELRGFIVRENGYIKIISVEDAKKFVDELYAYVKNLYERDRELVRRFGYVVSAKQRQWNAFTARAMLNQALQLVEAARNSLAIDHRLAVRIARIAREIVDYYTDNIRPLIEESERLIKRIETTIAAARREASELLNAISSLLSRYIVGKPITLSLNLVEDLEKALEKMKSIVESEIDEDTLRKDIETLWRSYRKSEVVNFPFYIRKLGPLYRYNYKLYKIVTELSDVIQFEGGDPDLCTRIKQSMERLHNLIEYVREAVESSIDLVKLRTELLQLLERSELTKHLKKYIESIDVLKLSIDSDVKRFESVEELEIFVKDLVERWRKNVVGLRDCMNRVSNLVKRVEELENELTKLVSDVETKLSRYREFLDRCSVLYDYGMECEKELSEMAKKLSDIMEWLKSVVNGEIEIRSIEDVEEVLRGIAANLDNAKRMLSLDNLVRCRKLVEEVMTKLRAKLSCAKALSDVAKELVERGASEAKTLLSEINEIYRKITSEGIDIVKACELSVKLDGVVEKVRKFIVNSGVLTHDELEVYKTLMQVRHEDRRSAIRFSEAVNIIAERLGMDRDSVKKAMLKLIEKELVEVYI